jgi:hypothetical protein
MTFHTTIYRGYIPLDQTKDIQKCQIAIAHYRSKNNFKINSKIIIDIINFKKNKINNSLFTLPVLKSITFYSKTMGSSTLKGSSLKTGILQTGWHLPPSPTFTAQTRNIHIVYKKIPQLYKEKMLDCEYK